MNRTKIFFAIAVVLSMFFSHSAFANTGFLGEPMWISPENPQEGDIVTLSAAFHNAENNQLTGSVLFYDGNVLLGKKTIVMAPGSIGTAAVAFKIGSGDHVFSANVDSLIELSSSGGQMPFAIPLDAVKMSKVSVASAAAIAAAQVANLLPAQAVNSVGTQIANSPVVSSASSIGSSVLDKLPDSIKTPVVDTATGIDDWRAKSAVMLTRSVEGAKVQLAKVQKLANDETLKYGKPTPTTRYVDRPLAYVKLFLLTLLAFLYSNPVVFYVFGTVFAFVVIRFIYRKIKNYIQQKKMEAQISKIPRAPRF